MLQMDLCEMPTLPALHDRPNLKVIIVFRLRAIRNDLGMQLIIRFSGLCPP